MILILTNSQDVTADYLHPILLNAGLQCIRLDTDHLINNASVSFRDEVFKLTTGDIVISPQQVSHVWYRRPEPLENERFSNSAEGMYVQNEWSEAIEAFLAHIPKSKWMNHPSANSAASHKLEQLTTARTLGFSVPDTLMTLNASELQNFFKQHNGQIIVKPMSNGCVERTDGKDSIIYTNRVESHHLNILDDLSNCPTLFQQMVQKRCDVRITIVDDNIHAVELFALDANGSQRCDIRRNNMCDVEYAEIVLPDAIKSLITKLISHYNLRFGAIDMAIDMEGRWYFFEINSNGQWAWLDLVAGMNIADSFVKAFSIV
jgi:glutathione synthase/RimK-type ligase-like ATP-grasp enzyme